MKHNLFNTTPLPFWHQSVFFAAFATLITATAVPPAAAPAVITGIFDAGWNSHFRDSSGWDLQCERLASIGMTTLITQFGIDAPTQNYFESDLAWSSGYADRSFYHKAIPAAEKHGIELYLGIYWETGAKAEDQPPGDLDGWWPKFWENQVVSSGYLERQRDRSIEVIDELEALYPSDAVVGYYIPHEVARAYWSNPDDLARLRDLFLLPVASHIRSVGKKVLVSPFFNPDLETPAELQQFVTALLTGSGIDIIAIQDGVGSQPKRFKEGKFGAYLRAVDAAAQATGTEYWVNVELFPDAAGEEPSGVALNDRIRVQIDSAAALSYCSKLVSYDYSSITEDHYAHTMNSVFDTLAVWHSESVASTAPKGISTLFSLSFRDGVLFLNGPAGTVGELELYDIVGRTVLSRVAISSDRPVPISSGGGVKIARVRSGNRSATLLLPVDR